MSKNHPYPRVKMRYPLPTTRTDKWGQIFVECPVCGMEFKDDGVAKHIRHKSKTSPSHQKLAKEILFD